MNFLRKLFCKLFAGLILCTWASPTHAQTAPPLRPTMDESEIAAQLPTAEEFEDGDDTSYQPKLAPELKKAFAEMLKVPIDSPLMQKFISVVENPTPKPSPESKEYPVIRHLVSKDDGIALPDPAPLRAKLAAKQKEIDEKTDQMLSGPETAEAQQVVDSEVGNDKYAELTPPALPSCPLDLSKVVPLQDGDPPRLSADETVISDFLLIRAPPPLNADTAFGQGTNVVQYLPKKGDYISNIVAMEGMPCLPYRIRLTSKHVIHDLGLNALKNYDQNPKGELYEGIKQRLSEFR